MITPSSQIVATILSLLESFSLEFEGPGPGVISWLHSVRIGSSTTNKTTHCSATSPSTLIDSSQEAEGGLFPNPILQPFCHYIRVFGITYSLFYEPKRSSGGRRVGTAGRRNVVRATLPYCSQRDLASLFGQTSPTSHFR